MVQVFIEIGKPTFLCDELGFLVSKVGVNGPFVLCYGYHSEKE